MQKIDVAACIWPAYTGQELRTRIFGADGIGEWQTWNYDLSSSEGDFV